MREFNSTVLDRTRRENQVADFPSRLNNSGEVVLVSDNFPEEHLFVIYVITPWCVDIANYLS